ncbi:fungal-specific transcription factor domain-containing protein [Aspergillus pseudoustus]|uniref:Fungal-specific transcription factor domain-containing protein n=1 Tax=Aspergillus pseudoustus TaxID=1810923 RepID=A0ABR4JJ59_9EURO
MPQDNYHDLNIDIYTPSFTGCSTLPPPSQVALLVEQGAFTIPEKPVCDQLVQDYFHWVAPVLPVLDRSTFLRQYEAMGVNACPSLLLLQAMFLAASRVSQSSLLLTQAGSGVSMAEIFYERAKALYDAAYECDQIATLQAVVLMGWYCGQAKPTETTFYWSRIAIYTAQSIGLHRMLVSELLSTTPSSDAELSSAKSNLPFSEKQLYKRIWWTLFTRDRYLSVCLGSPLAIDLADCDVETITDADFANTEETPLTEVVTSWREAQFFVAYAQLSEIIGHIYTTHYSATSNIDEEAEILDYDSCLAGWLQALPPALLWQGTSHEYWASLLRLHYCYMPSS